MLCCSKKMFINEDTSAECSECGRFIYNAVQCATTNQYYENGGRKVTPYYEIKYLRKCMTSILGESVFLSTEIVNQIKDNLSDGTIYDVRRALKKLKLKKYYRNTSYIRSILLDLPLPIVSPNDMVKVEALFLRKDSVSYYPNFIYEAFHSIDPNHSILDWIIKR